MGGGKAGSTKGAGKRKLEQLRKESVAKTIAKQKQREDEILNLQGNEKILFEIAEIESLIKICEFDLNGVFKNNQAIKLKLKNAQDLLQLKKLELLKENQVEESG